METLCAFLKSYAYDPTAKKPMRTTVWAAGIIATLIMLFMTMQSAISMNALGLLYGWMLAQLDREHLRLLFLTYALIFVIVRLMLFILQFAPEQYRKFIAEQEQNRKDDEY